MGRQCESVDICAVVVTYHPLPEYVENIVALSEQVQRVLVVDNGSDAASLSPVRQALAPINGILLPLGRNLGIGAALNAALRYAQENGFSWLATFDQDSRVTPGMIATMIDALEGYADPERVTIITPRHVDQGLNKTIQDRPAADAGQPWRVLTTTLTSGNLVRVQPALAAGGFDEGLFIDYVDHEFCLRLRRLGQQVLEASHATLLHALGHMQWHRFLGAKIAVVNQPRVRRYYMSRNRLIVWRAYWRTAPLWVLRDMRRFVSETLLIVLYEGDVRRKLSMICRGLRDGLAGVRGAFDPAR